MRSRSTNGDLDPHSGSEPQSLPSATSVNLHSASATRTAKIVYTDVAHHDFPIIAFRCLKPLETCIRAKEWLLQQSVYHGSGSPDCLRLETQELSEMKPDAEGTLLVLDFAAWLAGGNARYPVSIMAILVPRDARIRWLWSLESSSYLLSELERLKLIEIRASWEPKTKRHRQFFTFLVEAFERAHRFPDHIDYIRAMCITDYAPEIEDEDTALMRLARNEFLYYRKGEDKDISDDRYLLHLHPAERELASITDLQCAEYLFVKRSFFQAFYRDVMRKIGDKENAKPIRVAHTHQTWLEKEMLLKGVQTKKLITGWGVLGLLDQDRLMMRRQND